MDERRQRSADYADDWMDLLRDCELRD